MKSSAHLIANKQSLKDNNKREKIFDIVTLMSVRFKEKNTYTCILT